jgi:hypothetical protein
MRHSGTGLLIGTNVPVFLANGYTSGKGSSG